MITVSKCPIGAKNSKGETIKILHTKKVVPCTRELFESIINSPAVKADCDAVEGISRRKGEEEAKPVEERDNDLIRKLAEEKTKKKAELPYFTFCCTLKNGCRRDENAVLNGLYMADFDNVGDVSHWLQEKAAAEGLSTEELLAGWHEGHGMVLVHITPGGMGLRIVAKADPAIGNLWDNAAHLGRQLGLTPDPACKDAARVSLAFPKENLLYLSDELFTYSNPAYDAMYGDSYRKKESSVTEKKAYQQTTFYDIPYSDIIAALLPQLVKDGKVVEGMRNTTLLRLAAQMRYICDNDVERLMAVTPTWGLDDEERRTTIRNACKMQMYPAMPKILRTTLKQLGAPVSAETDDETDDAGAGIAGDARRQQLEAEFEKLVLPPALKAVVNGVDRNMQIGAVLASLPMFYTLLTRVSFNHFHRNEQTRLSGMTFIIGPAASGKSFFLPLKDLLLKPLLTHDEAARDIERKYREEREKAKNSEKQPERPHQCIRVLPTQISNTMIATRMSDAVDAEDRTLHLHCITVESEIATYNRSQRSGAWAQKYDILCKAFHNEMWGQDYASENSTNGEVEVNYNLVMSGTEDAFRQFIPEGSLLGGLPSRLMLFDMPDTTFATTDTSFKVRSKAAEKLLSETAFRLDKLRGHVKTTKLANAMRDWCNEMALKATLESDRELAELRKRTALIGERAGVVYAILSQLDKFEKGKPLTITDKACRFACFIANYCLYTQYTRFAIPMREQRKKCASKGPKPNMLNLTALYNKLPAEFTLEHLAQLRPDSSANTNSKLCSRWVKQGFIHRTAKGSFEKTIENV